MNYLSESAVATLRFLTRGYRMPVTDRRIEAFRELAAAGIMESVPGTANDYRFTAWGLSRRAEILAREEDRIERERYAPPDGDLSDAARGLLRRIASGRVAVDDANRPTFRELAAARVITLGSSFAGGSESAYRFTYWGWHRRLELAGIEVEGEVA